MGRYETLWKTLNQHSKENRLKLFNEEDGDFEEEVLTSKQKDSLDDSQFGIPETRSYPLIDEIHVRQAIRMFNYVDSKYEKELAKNILKAIKKYKMKVQVGENNKFYKYFNKED